MDIIIKQNRFNTWLVLSAFILTCLINTLGKKNHYNGFGWRNKIAYINLLSLGLKLFLINMA